MNTIQKLQADLDLAKRKERFAVANALEMTKFLRSPAAAAIRKSGANMRDQVRDLIVGQLQAAATSAALTPGDVQIVLGAIQKARELFAKLPADAGSVQKSPRTSSKW
jgi:hypothetical protein